MATATYTVADAKTDQVAITFKWRTLLPTDVAAATLADLGGALQSGTGSIAANASPRQAQFSVTTTPNTTVEGDRSFDVEIYDVTPSGTTLTVSKVRTKIVEDDVAQTNIFGPAATADTTSKDVGSIMKYKLTTTVDNTAWQFWFGGETANGFGGYILEQVNSSHLKITEVNSAGQMGTSNQMTYQDWNGGAGATNGGVDLVVTFDRTTAKLNVIIQGVAMAERTLYQDRYKGPFTRFLTGAAARPAVTIAAVS